MTGLVLTLLERPDAAPGLLGASERMAGLMGGACIEVLAVRMPPEATILPSEEVLTHRHAARVRDREAERTRALRTAFDTWATRAQAEGATAKWCEIEGLVDAAVRDWGSRADLIVLPRPAGRDQVTAQEEIQAALFTTDRPVLVVPHGLHTEFGRRVAIAWRDDRHATRAVLSALRTRVPPEQVYVLAGVREGAPQPSLPPILAEHGVDADLHVMPVGHGVFGEALLSKAHELDADMLVMGAYQHSPMRELILGGVTRYVLGHANLPVLMRH